MFKELGQIMGLAKQLPKIKEEMERLQQRLGRPSVEPRDATPERSHVQRATTQIRLIDIGDFQLAPRGRTKVGSNV